MEKHEKWLGLTVAGSQRDVGTLGVCNDDLVRLRRVAGLLHHLRHLRMHGMLVLHRWVSGRRGWWLASCQDQDLAGMAQPCMRPCGVAPRSSCPVRLGVSLVCLEAGYCG